MDEVVLSNIRQECAYVGWEVNVMDLRASIHDDSDPRCGNIASFTPLPHRPALPIPAVSCLPHFLWRPPFLTLLEVAWPVPAVAGEQQERSICVSSW